MVQHIPNIKSAYQTGCYVYLPLKKKRTKALTSLTYILQLEWQDIYVSKEDSDCEHLICPSVQNLFQILG